MITFMKKYSYIWLPILGGFFGLFAAKYDIINKSESTISSITNISGVLAGFMFTAYAIFAGMPSDKGFVIALKEYGYFALFFRHLIVAITLNFITMLISLANCPVIIPIVIFFAGLANCLCVFYLLVNSISQLHNE